MYEYQESNTSECNKNQICNDGVMSRNMLEEMTNVWCVHAANCGDGTEKRNQVLTFTPQNSGHQLAL
jgi:hypothetical protein